MVGRYGYPLDRWEQAKDEMRQILIRRAKAGEPIAYSELVAQIGALSMEPDSYALAAMLGEISTDEDDAGRGMLSVLVVHKDGDMRPGSGFFELATELRHDTSNREKFWIDEFKRVCAYWGTH